MKAGWEIKTLGEVCRIELGSTPSRGTPKFWDKQKTTGNIWLSIKDLPLGTREVVSESREYVSDLAASTMKVVPKGTLVVSFKLTLGRLAFAGCDLRTNEAIAALHDINSSLLQKDYLYWYLTFFDWNEAAKGDEKIKGKTLNKSKLREIAIPLPPLEEQKRIVSILDEAFEGLDRARENAEANLKSAGELFEGYLATTFDKQGETWSKYKLGSLCSRITVGFVGPMAHKYQDEGIPFLRSQNVRPFEINLQGIKYIDSTFNEELKKSKLLPGDVAIVRTGYPGTAATIPESLGQANCSDIVIATPGERLLPEFLVMFLNSDFGKRLVAAKSVGAAQKHFNVTAAKAVNFPTPTIQEQEHLVKTASRRREECLNLEALYTSKLQDISNLRQSLLQKAFAGELT